MASVLATHEALPDLKDGTAATLSRRRRRHSFLANPAIGWKVAFDFYRHTTCMTHSGALCAASARSGRPVRAFRVLRRKLADAEAPRWEEYVENRVRAKGWDGDLLMHGLRKLPRSVPQAQRWFLLKAHLNAPLSSGRLATAQVHVEETACPFCKVQTDTFAHACSCPAVMAAYDNASEAARLPHLVDARWALMLQSDWDGASVAGVLAFFAAVWNVRAVCRRGVALSHGEALAELVLMCLNCPWLTRCCATKTKPERRAERVREQAAVPDTAIYRSDGASRGQGSEGDSAAGWGAAVWNASPDGWGAGPSTATARGFLGEHVSNNVAEYFAVRECMRRASRCQAWIVMFEVDSMLVSK